jgi:long-chain acyl-CoA synthetase
MTTEDWTLKELVADGDVDLTAAELSERAQSLAGWLAAKDMKPGDAVCYFLENSIPIFEIVAACQLLGLRPVPINYHYTAEEARYILEDSGARALITSGKFAALLATASSGLDNLANLDGRKLVLRGSHDGFGSYEDALKNSSRWTAEAKPPPGVVVYTSGTTGHPKGVERRPFDQATTMHYLRTMRDVCGLGTSPVHLVTGPLYHSAPSGFSRVALQVGGRVAILPRFDAEAVLASIERLQITNLHLVPTMMHRLLELPAATRERYDLSSLKTVQHAAAPCPPAIKRAMIEWWGPVIEEYYGATESGVCTYITSVEALERPGSVGRAVPGVDLQILNEAGEPQGPGEVGDVCVDNPIVQAFTYHGDPSKRAQANRGRFYASGDMGYLDDEGYLFLCDRRAHMIISGGVNIYPAEIEAVISTHPKVHDCAVFGIPNPEWGESVHAAVQPVAGQVIDQAEMSAYLGEHVARYKIPRSMEFVTELPREASGKIFKRKLRDPYWKDQETSIA